MKGAVKEKKERNNRMGQQARRALAERIHGKHAKHLIQKENEDKRSKLPGIGARDEKEMIKEEHRAKERKKLTDGVLHPSWEAARKAKEVKDAVLAEAMKKPAGKKITFD